MKHKADYDIVSVILSALSNLRVSLLDRIIPDESKTIPWKNVKRGHIDPVLDVLQNLSAEKTRLVSDTVFYIHKVAKSKTCPNTIGSLLRSRGKTIPEKFASYSAINKAIFAYLNLSDADWEALKEIAEHDERPRDELTIMELLVPDEIYYEHTEEKELALRDAVCRHIAQKEYRGQYGECRYRHCPERHQDIYVLLQDDHIRSTDVWKEGNHFETIDIPASSRAVFIYDYEGNNLHIIAQVSSACRRELGTIWAREVLGIENVQERGKARFNVQQFAALTSDNIEIEGASSLISARVVGLKIQVASKDPMRIGYEAPRGSTRDIVKEARDMLDKRGSSLDQVRILRLTIAVTYRTPQGKECRTRFWISPESSNYEKQSEFAQVAILEFMEERKVLNHAA